MIIPSVFLAVFLAVFIGLCLGSFATALIHRIPQKKSLSLKAPRSVCVSCSTALGPLNLVPVLSWAVQKGKCHSCGASISPVYPLVELLSAVLCAVVYLKFGFSAQGVVLMALVPVLIAMVVIDIRYMILPNVLVFSAFILGLLNVGALILEQGAAAFLELGSYKNLMAMIVYGAFVLILGGVMKTALKKEALGMGDVKLFAVAGLWLGLPALPIYAMLSGMIGVAYVLVAGAVTKGKTSALFPFGPALISALFVLLIIEGSHFF